MLIPKDSQELINKCKTGRTGALTNQPGYKWILETTSYLKSNAPIKQRIWHIENDISDPLLCPICNRKALSWNRQTNEYKKVCSVQCAAKDPASKEKKKSTNIERYGHENIAHGSKKEQIKQTNLERYGVENHFMLSEVQENNKQIMLEKYGAKYALQIPDFQEKLKRMVLEKYKVESTNQLEGVKEKKRQTYLDRYGVESPLQNENIQQRKQETDALRWSDQHYNQQHLTSYNAKLLNDNNWLYNQHYNQNKTLTKIAEDIGCSETIISRRFIDNNWIVKRFPVSQPEKDIIQFLDDHGISNIISNSRSIIAPLELDIYLPDYSLAIEYCGLYWHSSKFKPGTTHHRTKLDACNKKGIRLVTLFEDEWIHNKELVKQKLLSIVRKDSREKVFARKCKIVQVDTNTKIKFFDTNHIQGNGPGSINIGLEYNGELVACMSFIKQPNKVMNLNRYATSKQVVGGFSKLLSHFKKNYDWNEILSFADLRWSQGNMYQINGFVLDKILPPDYEYVNLGNMTRIHKFNFRHTNLPTILGDNYDPMLSETQNTWNNGWYKIYHCGLLRYKITK